MKKSDSFQVLDKNDMNLLKAGAVSLVIQINSDGVTGLIQIETQTIEGNVIFGILTLPTGEKIVIDNFPNAFE